MIAPSLRMRMLITGPARLLPLWRPATWAARHGHLVWVAEEEYGHWLAGSAAAPLDPARGLSMPLERLPPPATGLANPTTAVANLQQLATQIRPHLVHAHNLGMAGIYAAAANLHPLVVSTWGGLNPLLEGGWPAGPPEAVRRILAAADALVVGVAGLVAPVRQFLRPNTPVIVAPLGCDTQRFAPQPATTAATWRRALRIPDTAAVLLSPRGWNPIYQHEQIITALAMARPRLQRPVVLVFSQLGRNSAPGEAEACQALVRTRAVELGLSDMLRWTPTVIYDLMPTLYALADLVISYPTTDALASTLIEVAACERPMISSRLPAYTGTFVEEFATLVDPTRPDELADAIVALVNQPVVERAVQLQAARAAVVEHHDESLARGQILQLYTELVGAQR